MRMKRIAQIQASLRRYHTITTKKKSNRILDGSYESVFKGRSMNFDELREYVPGDDVKDIDWKASSRSQKVLTRQFIAEKKHNIMLVMDTNRRMLAETPEGMEKGELATLGGGTFGYMVAKNGDYVGATYSTEDTVKYQRFRMGLMNLEVILEAYHNAITDTNTSNLNRSLNFILRNFHRRMILVVVTDRAGIEELDEHLMRQILVAHDILLIQVGDANIKGKDVYDVETQSYLPEFFSRDKKLAKIADARRKSADQATKEKLKKLGIACVKVDYVSDLDDQAIALLYKLKMEKRAR